MRGSSVSKRAVVLGVAMMLAIGAFAGVSFGGGRGITQPTTISLVATTCGGDGAHCRFYPLTSFGGKQNGDVETFNVPIVDEDGVTVGRNRAYCVVAQSIGAQCTLTETIRAGAFTEAGTVMLSGLFHPNLYTPGGYVDTFAVLGGTGAYENVRGHATFGFDGTNFPLVLYLIP